MNTGVSHFIPRGGKNPTGTAPILRMHSEENYILTQKYYIYNWFIYLFYFIYLFIYLSIYLFTYLFILFIYLFNYSFIHLLLIHLSLYMLQKLHTVNSSIVLARLQHICLYFISSDLNPTGSAGVGAPALVYSKAIS